MYTCGMKLGVIPASRVRRARMNAVSRATSGAATENFILTRCEEGRRWYL